MTGTLFPSFNINEDTIKAMIWQPYRTILACKIMHLLHSHINVHCTTCTTVCVILVWPRFIYSLDICKNKNTEFLRYSLAQWEVQNFFLT